jgi:hypothetical protein
LVWWLFSAPPVRAVGSRGGWFDSLPQSMQCFEVLALVNPNDRRVAQLHEMAWALHQGTSPTWTLPRQRARCLLRQVVHHAPGRAGARLQLADALWMEAERLSARRANKSARAFRRKARHHYAAYVDRMGASKASKRALSRSIP